MATLVYHYQRLLHVLAGQRGRAAGGHDLRAQLATLGVAPRRDFAACEEAFSEEQSDGAAFGCGFDREEVHRDSDVIAGGSNCAGGW